MRPLPRPRLIDAVDLIVLLAFLACLFMWAGAEAGSF